MARRGRVGVTRATVAATLVIAAVTAAVWAWPKSPGPAAASDVATGQTRPTAPPLAAAALSPVEIAGLPEAAHDRVIAGLIPVTSAAVRSVRVGVLTAAAPLYRTDAARPVARMQVAGPFGDQNPIVVVASVGEWDLVLTPARQSLPSASPAGAAAAQTAGWMPARYIHGLRPASARITLHTHSRSLVVSRAGVADQVFRVGVGAASTPTPRGVTGYLEARFVNPQSGTRDTAIQLTSLHATTQDDPAGGVSGGLIALHWWPQATGAESHGCVRLSSAALAAVAALPLGTPISITE